MSNTVFTLIVPIPKKIKGHKVNRCSSSTNESNEKIDQTSFLF